MMDRRQEAGGRGRQEAGGSRQEARGRRQEAGGKRQEARGRRQEAGGRRQEAGGRVASARATALTHVLIPGLPETENSRRAEGGLVYFFNFVCVIPEREGKMGRWEGGEVGRREGGLGRWEGGSREGEESKNLPFEGGTRAKILFLQPSMQNSPKFFQKQKPNRSQNTLQPQ
jgi:hypothetical protein